MRSVDSEVQRRESKEGVEMDVYEVYDNTTWMVNGTDEHFFHTMRRARAQVLC